MYALCSDPAILPAAELGRLVSERAQLQGVVENPGTLWVERERAKARMGELTRLIEADAKARERVKADQDNRSSATNAREVAANAGECGGRQYSEQVLRRDGQGRPIDVIRMPIRTKRTTKAATAQNAAQPKFAPTAPYFETP